MFDCNYIYCVFYIIVVCVSRIIPMASGFVICVNVNLANILVDTSVFIMSGGILYKMLILGIDEMVVS